MGGFKPESVIPPHSGIFKLHMHAKGTQQAALSMASGELRDAFKLPPNINQDEWIAALMLNICEQVGQIVNLAEEFCTEDSCARMSAGKHVHYSWADEENPEPKPVSAPQYMRTLMAYAEAKLGDRTLLPIDGSSISKDFAGAVKQLCKRFFRVYAHIFIHHFEVMIQQDGVKVLEDSFKSFLFFVDEFDLVANQEMLPLEHTVRKFREKKDVYDRAMAENSDIGPEVLAM